MSSQHYDIIIIGSGAGGGTLAHRLAKSGKKILILERGHWLPREQANWDATRVFVENRYVSKDPWLDEHNKEFQPGVHYFVGGATKMFGAALFRLRPQDFQPVKYQDGISPAWPISYADLEPYYLQAEQLYQVHGQRGEDPTEGPASGPYPYPPIMHEPRIQELADRLAQNGYHPFHAPTAVMLNEQERHNSRCIKCDTCDGFPCLVQAKSDAENIAVRPALQHANVTLLIDAHVDRLNTSADGRSIREVLVTRLGEKLSFSADIVVVSAGAANTARLLLMSANDRHPKGLANGSDQVGRNYMFHNSEAVVALMREPNDTRFQKTLSINDFYFQGPDYAYPLGNIQMIGKSQGPMFRGDAPSLVPGFLLKDMAHHAVDFWLTTEDLPDPNNRITVTSTGQIKLTYKFNNQQSTQRLRAELQKIVSDPSMHSHLYTNHSYLGKTIPIAGVGHQAGTARFGTDPRTSVLDIHCKAYEIDNLYVVDTSFFPSIGAVNPSLTAIANALRVGDHIAARLR